MSRYVVAVTLYASADLPVYADNPRQAVERAIRRVQAMLDGAGTEDNMGWTVGQLGADSVTTARGHLATGWEDAT